MAISIIQMEEQHLRDVIQIEQAAFEEDGPTEWQSHEYYLRTHNLSFVAKVQGVIRGYIYAKWENTRSAVQVYVHQLAVHPVFRHQRMGANLLQTIIRQAQTNPECRLIYLIPENEDVQNFYKRFGFRNHRDFMMVRLLRPVSVNELLYDPIEFRAIQNRQI